MQCCSGHRNQFINHTLKLHVILQRRLAQKAKNSFLHSYCGVIRCDLKADGSPLAAAQDAVAIGVKGRVRQAVVEGQRELSRGVKAGLGAVELRRRRLFL